MTVFHRNYAIQVDIYYDLCDIEATALTRKGNLTSRGKKAAELAELFGDVTAVYGSYYWDGDDDFSDYDDYFDRVEKYDPEGTCRSVR